MRRLMFAMFILAVSADVWANDNEPQWQYRSLDELQPVYDAQINRLHAMGYTEPFGGDVLFGHAFDDEGEKLQERERVSLHSKLRKTMPIWVDEGNIPLLLVIPQDYAPLRWQARHVTIDGIRADAPQFELSRITTGTDDDSASRHPYIIFNVDMGTATLHTSVQGVEYDLKTRNRRGLTFAEGIALLIHYPNAAKCERAIAKNGQTRFAFGQCVFLKTRYGGACRYNKESEEVIVFAVREDDDSDFLRGYFTHVIRRDMTPNHTRFLFPSCDLPVVMKPQ